PFWLRPEAGGGWRYAFATDRRHTNPTGIVHGGALYSFADQFLGHAIVYGLKRACATVKLKVEYLAAVRPGQVVEGTCEIVRATRTMAFVRGRVLAGNRAVMTADGCFKLAGALDLARLRDLPEPEPVEIGPVEPPDGFRAFRLQGGFAGFYGPMHYRREADGSYVCGMQATAGVDNTNGVVHGGALFAFADDMMSRAVSATSRRFSATISLDAQYLAPGPLDAWLEGRADITRLSHGLAFVRGEVSHAGRPVLSADGIWRLFDRYD
ncbi:MAG TPA: PaaI family thioesterase, partial [Alphaproteobacteria bacterium]|nr:PaaI family thioesterase [Alphaproteobacteria bacterium]